MSPLKGLGAATAACFTSRLAGIFLEVALKGSRANLWVKNSQGFVTAVVTKYSDNIPKGFATSLAIIRKSTGSPKVAATALGEKSGIR
ncbi:hypothetical protein BJ322DRAFT_1105566 [Thelephora terrestris]|uniref:Uncharacterized protein n=1 Tax=Thelephora terrestris TaxID=56493 RepID=A0A9P6L9S0_9AGAM|nr:hypothetical protein BJ322DRAFT_1105566 [Thelephora terrestris]